MMITRKLGPKLTSLFSKFPVLTLVGPRQSGKTTLAKALFAHLPYVNMEDFTMRSFAIEDPKSFLKGYPDGLIIDEVQHVPELFSYLQLFVDEKDRPGQYVLTGSQQFLVNAKISQSLAGRVALTTLLPLAYSEIKDQ
jgi:predicted AAA+ superfamily ATPase